MTPELEDTDTRLARAQAAAKVGAVIRKRVAAAVGSVAGVVFAFVMMLKFENIWAAVLGFVVALVCSGLVLPAQVGKYLPWGRGE